MPSEQVTQKLRDRLSRVERELRLFHERELEEPCACEMCERLYTEDKERGADHAE